MSSTYSWNGGTAGTWATSANWTFVSGASNAGFPQPGDTGIFATGTVQIANDTTIPNNTVELGTATLTFTGDGAISLANPTFGAATVVTSALTPPAGSAENSVLNAVGTVANEGIILADGPAGSTFTLNVKQGGTAATAIFGNTGTLQADAGNTLIVNIGTASELYNAGNIVADGGSVDVAFTAGATLAGSGSMTIAPGGTLQIGGALGSGQTIDFTPGSGESLRLAPASVISGNVIGNFGLGDTIDLGPVNVSTVVFDGNGDILAIGASGTVFSASTGFENDGPLDGFGNAGTFVLPGTGGIAGNLRITESAAGDTLITALAPSAWRWVTGVSGSFDNAANWTLVSGPGSGWDYPSGPGDSAIDAGGSIYFGSDGLQMEDNTIALGGTAGTAALFSPGDRGLNFLNPSLDSASLLTSAVPGNTTAETSLLSVAGYFINEGTILADGPAGSSFTIAISGTTISSAFQPGYFFNPGTIQADAGNTLIINVGSASELFNSGNIIADGGTVKVNFAPGAVAGGDASVRGFDLIEGGGTLETGSFFPSSDGNNGTHGNYEFADSTPGNTLKIDNVGSFGGVIVHFLAGDTIDLGQFFSVGTLAYSTSTNLLSLEAANGGTLATLLIGNGGSGFANGTFAVTGGSADGFNIGVGADGDTVLTTSQTPIWASNTSGIWQSPTSWVGGVVPATTAFVGIGQNATTPFTLTTGSTPVSVGGIGIETPAATLQITSNTTLTSDGNTGQISDYEGTVDIATGNTLVGGAIQLYDPSTSFTLAAGATADLAGRLNLDLAPVNGVWSLQPGSNPFAFTVSAGTAVIDGALLAGPSASTRGGSVSIAYESAGTSATIIANGGATVTDTHDTMGSDPTSSGTLVINGANWTDVIDNQDTYNSRGNITVGYDDVALNTPGSLTAPTQIAAAQVLIENGGTLTDEGTGGSIGATEDSAGTVTVTNGGVWDLGFNGVSGGVSLGDGNASTGSLLVLNGGTVAIGQNGTYLSNGTTAVFGGIGAGQSLGSTGTIVVSGTGSELTNASGMTIGRAGQAVMSIVNGGTVIETGYGGGISVGTSLVPGSSGTIIVGGTGAPAALDFAPASGTVTASSGITVGVASQGTLIVADNGTINLNGTGYLTIGSSLGSSGSVIVGGTTAAAVINVGTDGITVGNSGAGYLAVNSLGTVNVTGNQGTSILIGQNSGASGTMVVNGGLVTEGPTATGLTVGLNSGASASLSVTNGGTVSLAGGGLNIGANSGANGSVTVQGGGSVLKTTGSGGILVGQSGSGTLTVGSGGTVAVNGSGSFIVGQFANETGQVLVSGGVVNLGTSSGGFIVGNAGNGTLTVNGGGSVTDANALTVGNNQNGNGVVNVSNGTISAADVVVASSGNGAVNIGGGGKVLLTGTTASTIGSFNNTSGTITVSGAGATLQGQTLDVGQGTRGVLNVQTGGSVSLSLLSLAGGASPAGGTGILSVTGGGEVQTGNLGIWQGGTVSVDNTAGSGIDVGTSGSFVTGSINIEAGHTLFGHGLVTTPVVDNGVIEALGATSGFVPNSGALEIQGSITGSGLLEMGPNGILKLDTAAPASETIQFGSGSELILNVPSLVTSNPITNLSAGDKIEFNFPLNTAISSASVTSPGTVSIITNVGTYLLTNVSFAAGASQQLSWGFDGSTGDSDIQVQPFYFNWGGFGGTDYSTASNWQGNVAPNGNDVVSFVNNPGTITGTGSALSINFGNYTTNVNNSGTWTLAGVNLTVGGLPNPPNLPFTTAFNESTVVNGGIFNAAGGVTNIGNLNGATVTAQNGATVTTGGDSIGQGSGQYGSLVVSGIGTTWTEQSGLGINGGTPGYLNVASTGAFSGQPGSAGSLTVTLGAVLTTGAGASIGNNTGAVGTANVTSGARWSITGNGGLGIGLSGVGTLGVGSALVSVGGGFASLGGSTGGVGVVNLTSGGTLTGGGGLNIGGSGSGTLVANGGTVVDTGFVSIGANTGGDGTVTLGGASQFSANGISVGGSGLGIMTVNGGNVTSTSGLAIGGNTGGEGTLTLSNGTLTSASTVNLGQGTDSTGVAILGPSAVMTAAGLNVGSSGFGVMTVNGGIITNSGGFTIGSNTGGGGTLTLSSGTLTNAGFASIAQGIDTYGVESIGPASVMTSNGLNVGGSGLGVLTVNGGTVTSFGTLSGTLLVGGGVAIGSGIGSDGSVSVSGGGRFDENGLTVGASGTGTLTLSGNSEITDASGLTVGNAADSLGIASVIASTVTVAANAIIGNSGAGTLTLGSGGTILANGTFDAVGNNAGGAGALVINSGGEFLAAGTAVAVGSNDGSSGELIVNAGGTLLFTLPPQTATSTFRIGNGAATSTVPAAMGTVLVTGAGALINTNDNPIAVGNSGLGSLTVAQGGSVVGGTPDSSLDYGLAIANSGGDGAVTVTGAGSNLTVNGYFLDGRGGSGALTIESNGVVVVNDAPANNSGVGIGAGRSAGPSASTNFGGDGVATVTTGGVLDLTSTVSGMTVGGDGVSGALTVNNGGTVLAGTGLTVGTATFAGGTIYGGNGELDIGAGGTVLVNNPLLTTYDITIGNANSNVGGPTSTASGQAIVSGAGALLNANGGGIAIGWLSSGDLTIGQGGSVVSGTPNSNTFAALAIGRQADGALTVSDPGTTYTANGAVYVGRAGNGSLTIENDGSMNVGVDGVGSGGITIGGAGYSNGTTLYTGGSGTGLVTSGGDLFSTQSVTVGENGTNGQLTVNTGGTVESGQRILIGNTTTAAAGDVIVNSATVTTLAATSYVTADGVIDVGAGGVLKADGSNITSPGTSAIVVAAGVNSVGDLNVTGSGALVNSGGYRIAIGGAGNGSALISQGGTMVAATPFVSDEAINIGGSVGAVGALTITDPGSKLIATGQMDVGNSGIGSLLVQNQATVITGNNSFDPLQGFDVGANAGSAGQASVIGSNSLLTNTGRFVVGDAGLGSLTIDNGGSVVTNPGTAAVTAAVIGNVAGSDGSSVTVSGAGSSWQIGGTLDVGNGASGALTIVNGGTVSASQVMAGTQSSVTGNILVSGAGSVLQALSLVAGTAGSAIVTIGTGGIVNLTNTATFGAHGILNLQGGTLDPAQVVFTSGRNGNNGAIDATVEIDNAGTIYASGGALTVNAPIVHVGTLGGAGVLEVDSGGDLVVNGGVDNSQSVAFAGAGTLEIGDIHQFAPLSISGFTAGDAIVVDGIGALSQSFNAGTDQLVLTDQVNNHYTLQFTGTHVASDFTSSVVAGSVSAGGAWSTDLSGDFDDPTKWIGGVVPTGLADAVIDFTDQPQVSHDGGNDSLHSVRNVAGNFGMSGGTLTVTALENDSLMSWTGGSLVLNSGVGGTATLLNTGGSSLTIAPNGQRLFVAGTGTESVANASNITVDGGLGEADIDAPLVNTGVVVVNRGTLSLNGGGSSNAFALQTGSAGVLAFGAPAGQTSGGTFALTGGIYGGVETVISGSTLDVSAASNVVFNDLRLTASGALHLGATNAQTNGAFIQGGTVWGNAVGTSLLSGSGNFVVFGGASITGGVQSGSGLTRLFGTGSIGGGFSIDGGRTVENDSFLSWSSGNIILGAGDPTAATQSGTLANVGSGILYVTAPGARLAVGGSGVLSNSGVVAFYAGAGEQDVDAVVNNTGYVQALSGVVSLNGGGSSDAGHLIVASGATLQFGARAGTTGGATFTLTGGGLTAGSVIISGSTLNASAASGGVSIGTLQLAGSGALLLGAQSGQASGGFSQGPGTFENASGTPFLSGTGTFLVFGGANLFGGVQSGSGVTHMFGTSVLGGSGFSLDGGRTLENDGWLNWSSGNLTLGSGDAGAVTHAGTLTNASGATMFVTASGSRIANAAGGVVNNAGVMAVYAGGGEIDIDATFNNTGYLQALSGVVSLNGGGSSDAGHLIEGSGAVLQFGTAASGVGGTFTITGDFYNAAVTQVTGGMLDLSAASGASFGTSMAVSGSGVLNLGTLFVNENALGVTGGGEVLSNGIAVVAGPAVLGNSVLSGTGTTVLNAGGSINGALQIDGGLSLQNSGTLVWSGGSIALGSGNPGAANQAGTLNNTAVFDIKTNGTISSPGTGNVFNSGTIAKIGGLGVTTVNASVNNSGTVDVTSGTLTFGQTVGGSGVFLLDGSATLDLVGGTGGGSTMQFLHPGGTLETQALGTFASTISGYAIGDAIDAASVAFNLGTTTVGFNNGTMTVSDGVHSAAFGLSGSYVTSNFHIASDGHNGTAVTYV